MAVHQTVATYATLTLTVGGLIFGAGIWKGVTITPSDLERTYVRKDLNDEQQKQLKESMTSLTVAVRDLTVAVSKLQVQVGTLEATPLGPRTPAVPGASWYDPTGRLPKFGEH